MGVDSISSLKLKISNLQRELHSTRALLESANSIVIRWYANGIVHEMNDFGLDFFGYSSEELIGQHITIIVPKIEKSSGRDMFGLAKDIAKHPDQYKSVPSENITKDGRTVWVTWTNKGIFDEQGNVQEILAIGNDITALKEAERKNLEYQGKLDAALESMDDAVLISDSQGNLVHLNEAFATFHKFKNKTECTDQIAAYPEILDVFLPDGTPAPLEQWAIPRALRGEFATDLEYSLRRKDTGEAWVGSYNFGPIFDPLGNILGAVMVARDITERKRAEKVLQASEAKLKRAQEVGHVGSWDWDIPSNKSFWSEEMYRIYGVDPESELTLEMISDIIAPEDLWKQQQAITEALAGHPIEKVDYRIIRPDGVERIVEITGIQTDFDKDGKALKMYGVAQDITERKRVEKERATQQKHLEALWKISSLRNADLQTICATVLSEITAMTDSPYGFYGFVDEHETAMTIYSWSRDTMKDCAIHEKPLVFSLEKSGIWGNAVRDRKPFFLNDYGEYCANKKGLPEGHVALTRVLSVPVFQNDKIVALGAVSNKPEDYTDQDIKQLSIFLSNVQIIIDQKQAEEKRLELEAQLRQKYKMEAVGVMAGGMAHNFNNNLAIILGNLELSKMKLPPQSEIKSFLDYAQIAALRSRDLVKQIMVYSRKQIQTQTSLQLSLLLKETMTLLQSTIPSSVNLRQAVSSDCEQTYIQADASQIQECLLNLCNNSVHAMAEQGELLLTLERIELKQEDIPARYDCLPGEYLCLSVRDNGSGIPAEIQEKIFDPFFTTKELYEGTGMGLSTVQGIVEQHHGMITVEGGVEQETTFHLYFPVVDQIEKEETEGAGGALEMGSERILYVDDEQMIADLNEQMLIELGYQVTIMTDSVEALELFSANADSFDLIMTDQTMPELTGKELIQQIKKLRPEIPTILCTGYSNKVNEEEALQAGVSAFLLKPTDLKELSRVIRTVLEKTTEP